MPNSNRPAGPGRATQERRDAAKEREELEDMTDAAQGQADAPARDPSRSARQAERDAHVKDSLDGDSRPGRQRP